MTQRTGPGRKRLGSIHVKYTDQKHLTIVTFQQILKVSKATRGENIWGKSIFDRRNSNGTVLEAGTCLVCSSYIHGIGGRSETVSGRVREDQVSE
jgi:hypothetical protein